MIPMATSMKSGSDSSSGSDSGSSSSLEYDISSAIDRLSDLPDPVICHILSLLPTKTVVATSILATRWKSLWTKVTSIDVSFDGEPSDSSRFAQIVNKVLLSRNVEPLGKFRLDWEIRSEQEAEYVITWVRYAIDRGLKFCFLSLGMEMTGNEINLPSTLFTCKSLESLQLSGWFTLQVPTFVCLPKLRVLDFTYLHLVSNEFIHKFILGCPLLHSLTLTIRIDTDIALKISSLSLRSLVLCNCYEPIPVPAYDKRLEIDAPSLEFLHLDVSSYDCSIKSPSASLNEVILHLGKNCVADSYAGFVNGVCNDRCNSTVKLVETLNRAKCLTILGDTMMAITRATIPISTPFERLTKLDVVVPCCEWSSLSVMLGCCSRLQFFSIMVLGSCASTHKRCWKDPEEVPACLRKSVAHVSFEFFKGVEDEMSMVRYFLKHGSVLESFSVVSVVPATSEKKLQMLRAIAEFPRLSSACSIKFA